MHDRPNALELLEAVTEFLSSEVLPNTTDHRMKFRTLVAINALGIAYRELTSGSEPQGLGERRELARRFRAGAPPPDVLATLKEDVAAKLHVSNPAYLEKYE